MAVDEHLREPMGTASNTAITTATTTTSKKKYFIRWFLMVWAFYFRQSDCS